MARSVGIGFETLGIPELREKFRALPLVLQRKIVRQASRAVSHRWKTAAQARARAITNPSNRSTRMLRVARSMSVRAIVRTRRFVGTRLMTAKRARLGIPEESRWYFPAHVHLGRKAKGDRKGVPGRPYLREPLIWHGEEWKAIMGQLIKEGIEREAAKPRVEVPPPEVA